MTHKAPTIWLLTDTKPGHRNQLRGLTARLRSLTGARSYWVNAGEHPVPLWRALLGLAPVMPETLPPPDLILAAGSGTHRLLLALRRRAATVVLMKPGFPRSWVSACLIPAHDNVSPGPRTLITQGAINNIAPLARVTGKKQALILIGGPSRHFAWDDALVTGQLVELVRKHPDWQWVISGSRRTPESLHRALTDMAAANVKVYDPQKTHEDWLAHQLAASRAVWVTPDSASMVYEAVTSGVPTGLFDLAPVTGSRMASGIADLQTRGYLLSWAQRQQLMTGESPAPPGLWEAERAARWLVTTLPEALDNKSKQSR